MKSIGLIGAGYIGQTVAQLALTAGYHVTISNSRNPDTLDGLAASLGPLVSVGTPAQAAACDLVIIAVPMHAIHNLPVEALAEKIVIDTNNYYPERDGQIAELDSGESTSSELLQGILSSSHVVKAMNNIVYSHLLQLGHPLSGGKRTTLPIAGNTLDAKIKVSQFLHDLGYDTIDVGPLKEGTRFQPGQPAYCLPYVADRDAYLASRPNHRPEECTPASREILATALEKAEI